MNAPPPTPNTGEDYLATEADLLEKNTLLAKGTRVKGVI